MRTAVISDLHLGALAGADVAARPGARERLSEALSAAGRVIVLGDLLELRERCVAESLAYVRPFFEVVGRALAGRQVVLVPGNHDHALADPWLSRVRLDGGELGPENEWPVEPGDGLAGRLSALMPDADLRLAYPGLYLRPDVYATHGHYLDLHLTVPRLESIAAGAMGRLTRRGQTVAAADDYEAILAPLYAFYGGLAQAAPPAALRRGGAMSRGVWERVTGNGRAGRFLLGRVTIPVAVAALNGLGLGPAAGRAQRRGAAQGRSAGDGPGGRHRGAAGRPRHLRPHPPGGPAPGRRPGRVDDGGRNAVVEQRHLVPRGRLREQRRPAQPVLARQRPAARRQRRAAPRERARTAAGGALSSGRAGRERRAQPV